jgi:alkaline phosphatase D
MISKFYLIIFFTIIYNNCFAQTSNGIVSAPWAGNIQLRNATIWIEVGKAVKSVGVKYYFGDNLKNAKTVTYKGELGKDFNPVKIDLNGLNFNTTYNYAIIINGKPSHLAYKLQFTTKDLWQYRKPAPDFTFLTGSCAYFNEPVFDRPGKPYGGDSSIFETMAKTQAAFNLWLGDNWYTREVDYSTAWGLHYRASRDMSLPVLQKFKSSMSHYAIWDDHDYGPNDAGKSFILKEESRKVFMNYWCNPSYGEEGKGIYTKITYSDVDIFLTDDRFFRSEVEIPDSINGQPNTAKSYFGSSQMEWLKNSLLFSSATFKIIVSGSQVLNPYSDFDCMKHYSYEYSELMNFLLTHKIKGIIFFSGDRHHSEIIKLNRSGIYSLYDVTVSPFTAGIGKVRGAELNNESRIKGTLVEEQNFGKVTVNGIKDERILKVEFIGIKGDKLSEWSISEKELK